MPLGLGEAGGARKAVALPVSGAVAQSGCTKNRQMMKPWAKMLRAGFARRAVARY
jgi:hypothetical protein